MLIKIVVSRKTIVNSLILFLGLLAVSYFLLLGTDTQHTVHADPGNRRLSQVDLADQSKTGNLCLGGVVYDYVHPWMFEPRVVNGVPVECSLPQNSFQYRLEKRCDGQIGMYLVDWGLPHDYQAFPAIDSSGAYIPCSIRASAPMGDFHE